PARGAVMEGAPSIPRLRKRNKRNRSSNESNQMSGDLPAMQFTALLIFTPTHGSHMSWDAASPAQVPRANSEPLVQPIPQASHTSPNSRIMAPPANPTVPTMLNEDSAISHTLAPLERIAKHSRGDRSVARAPDMEGQHTRRPQTTAQSFVLQLMVNPGDMTRAMEIVSAASSSPDLYTETHMGDSEPDLALECRSLVQACMAAFKSADVASYQAMLLNATLALWVLSVQGRDPDFSIIGTYRLLESFPEAEVCSEQQFRRWHSNGHTLLQLIHASSIHTLLAIAISTLRDVTNHLSDGVVMEVENALWQPRLLNEAMAGLVYTGVIQFVRDVQTRIPAGIRVGGHRFGVDQADDDRYLAKMLGYARKDFELIPWGSHWDDMCDPFPTLRCQDDPTLLSPTVIIKTQFDPQIETNRLLPAELRAMPNSNAQWTEAERVKASLAPSPDTLDDFSTKLHTQLESSVKTPNSYIKLPVKLYANSNVLIHGVGSPEEDLIDFVMSGDTLTPVEKQYILQIVKLTSDINDQVVNTAEVGPGYEFDGHHYGVWGKMSKSGKLAPKKMHPCDFLGESSQPSPYLDCAV
ncbi:hypothetical protein FRC06_008572, partial [Ceratobasidium sp. 370]